MITKEFLNDLEVWIKAIICSETAPGVQSYGWAEKELKEARERLERHIEDDEDVEPVGPYLYEQD